MKIVTTGKNGLLVTELIKIDSTILPLSSKEFDITEYNIVSKLVEINPDIIIHCAAITDSNLVSKNKILAIKTNIIGTAFIAEYCIVKNKRLVYISTDYVYPGIHGSYKETDSILPHNDYAWTKLGGECSVRFVKNHLIIRTSFGKNKFPYKKAWTNQIVSKDYVDIISPKILEAAKSNLTGILNIGTEPKTVYEYAKKRNVDIIASELKENKNFSLNIKKYEELHHNR